MVWGNVPLAQEPPTARVAGALVDDEAIRPGAGSSPPALGRGTRMPSSMGTNCVLLWWRPGVITTESGRPLPSQGRSNVVASPPRLRPSPDPDMLRSYILWLGLMSDDNKRDETGITRRERGEHGRSPHMERPRALDATRRMPQAPAYTDDSTGTTTQVQAGCSARYPSGNSHTVCSSSRSCATNRVRKRTIPPTITHQPMTTRTQRTSPNMVGHPLASGSPIRVSLFYSTASTIGATCTSAAPERVRRTHASGGVAGRHTPGRGQHWWRR